MSKLRIDPGDGEQIATLHKDAASGIEKTASSLPGSVDAGIASALISDILAQLTEQADQLSIANESVGNMVSSVVKDLDQTDEEAAGPLRRLKSSLNAGGEHPRNG